MKRSIKAYALAAVTLLVFLLAFSACGLHNCSFNDDDFKIIKAATHTTTGLKSATCFCGKTTVKEIPKTEEHAYGAWTVSKESTCTEDGLEIRVCICKHVDSRAIPALHNNLDKALIVTEDATCEKDGTKKHVCAVCEETICEELIPALGHKAQAEWVVNVAAGCETSGTKQLSCETCEALLETQVIPATGHTYDVKNDGWVLYDDNDCTTDDTKERVCATCGATESEVVPASHRWETVNIINLATCNEDGLARTVCKLCGENDTIVIPALGHDYCQVVNNATCTEDGYEKVECSACGNVCEMKLIPATGHNYVEVIDSDATCAIPGSKHQECEVCQALLAGSQEGIPVIDHNFGNWNLISDATCTADGSQVRFCSRCGAEDIEIFTKLDHVYAWDYACDEDIPTCTKSGLRSWICACGDVQGFMTEKAKGHAYSKEVTAPTCTEEGYTTYTCANCDDTYTDDATEKLAHNFGAWNLTLAASCTAPGLQTRWCSVCNAKDTEEIPMVEHTFAWETATPAGCETPGEDRYTCACGYYTATKVVDALGHDMGETQVEVPSSCTENGTGVQYCQREGCSHKEDITIEAAHIWLEEQILTAPTCTAEGEALQCCANCNEKNYIVLEKVDHTMAWIEVTPQINGNSIVWADSKATCTHSGYATYKCTECDCYTGDFKVTAKTSHTPAEDWVVDAPTCTKEGRAHLHCSECNAELQSKLLLPTGHTDIKWVDDNAAGISKYACSCGKVFDKASLGLVIKDDTLVSVGTCTAEVIYVPTTVKNIGASAFDSCTTLTTIYLPAGLVQIGENAFRDCKNLTNIYFDGSTADWNAVAKGVAWDKNTGNYTVY